MGVPILQVQFRSHTDTSLGFAALSVQLTKGSQSITRAGARASVREVSKINQKAVV